MGGGIGGSRRRSIPALLALVGRGGVPGVPVGAGAKMGTRGNVKGGRGKATTGTQLVRHTSAEGLGGVPRSIK